MDAPALRATEVGCTVRAQVAVFACDGVGCLVAASVAGDRVEKVHGDHSFHFDALSSVMSQ